MIGIGLTLIGTVFFLLLAVDEDVGEVISCGGWTLQLNIAVFALS